MVEEGKDQAIKLFGKTIPLPEIAASGCGGGDDDDEIGCSSSATNTETEARDAKADFERDGTNSEALVVGEVSAGLTLPVTASSRTENPQAPSSESHSSTVQQPSSTEEEAENKSQLSQQNAASPEKALKKPDKILPCPRCKSMETKFCYFNNYNVNQPRHFCKNCQRYWTAGGTMRNVPVGAGRRKSKSSASHYRHVILSDQPLQGLGADVANTVHYPALKSQNGTSLIAFGPDNPICDMTSILNLVESSRIRTSDAKINPLGTKGNGGVNQVDAAASYSLEGDNKAGPKDQLQGRPAADNALVYPPQLACFPGATWPYPWNSTQWGSQLPNPGFGSSGFSVALYPPGPYWGCSGSWAIKWAPPLQSPPPNVPNSSSSPSPNSPMLGKHSRDGNILRSSSLGEAETPSSKDSSTASERCLWVPKTLRIDDPEEAAKSSIWTTLGIKNPRSDSVCGGGGIFRACFSSKDGGKSGFVEATPRRSDANPASLLRSQSYNEAS